jgi:hypothetical protein
MTPHLPSSAAQAKATSDQGNIRFGLPIECRNKIYRAYENIVNRLREYIRAASASTLRTTVMPTKNMEA